MEILVRVWLIPISSAFQVFSCDFIKYTHFFPIAKFESQ